MSNWMNGGGEFWDMSLHCVNPKIQKDFKVFEGQASNVNEWQSGWRAHTASYVATTNQIVGAGWECWPRCFDIFCKKKKNLEMSLFLNVIK